MKNDLISRSALIEDITGVFNRHYENSCYQFIHDFFKCTVRRIDNAPAVDAVEIGSCDSCYWKEVGRYHKCSCCRRNRDLKDCYRRANDEN